mmetsp:Transcript_70711/g.147262  ORF Transcript_70711/g.147262 Transcript_70711/m.147262 type:complete len:269 (+) Transcript_70711:3001-3807(+)
MDTDVQEQLFHRHLQNCYQLLPGWGIVRDFFRCGLAAEAAGVVGDHFFHFPVRLPFLPRTHMYDQRNQIYVQTDDPDHVPLPGSLHARGANNHRKTYWEQQILCNTAEILALTLLLPLRDISCVSVRSPSGIQLPESWFGWSLASRRSFLPVSNPRNGSFDLLLGRSVHNSDPFRSACIYPLDVDHAQGATYGVREEGQCSPFRIPSQVEQARRNGCCICRSLWVQVAKKGIEVANQGGLLQNSYPPYQFGGTGRPWPAAVCYGSRLG